MGSRAADFFVWRGAAHLAVPLLRRPREVHSYSRHDHLHCDRCHVGDNRLLLSGVHYRSINMGGMPNSNAFHATVGSFSRMAVVWHPEATHGWVECRLI